jgi:uncharacterized protein involved in outer membrane biogenesis
MSPLVATLKRRWYMIPVAALALVLVAVILVFVFLGQIVRTGVGTILPKITGTPASIAHFRLNPLTGNLAIRDFAIGNPEGYQAKDIFVLKELKVGIDVGSLFSDRIVIREILVDGLQVNYETKVIESNLGRIRDNVDQYSKKEEKAATTEQPGAEPGEKKPGKKVQIDDLRIVNGSVAVRTSVSGIGAGATVPLPEIHLTGIGKETDGASTAEVAEEVFTALYQAIMKAVASVGSINTKDIESIGDQATEKAKGLVKGIENLFE